MKTKREKWEKLRRKDKDSDSESTKGESTESIEENSSLEDSIEEFTGEENFDEISKPRTEYGNKVKVLHPDEEEEIG